MATLVLKVAPLPALVSIRFKTLATAYVNFTTTTPQGSQVRFPLCLDKKLISRRTTFSSAAIPTHATAMAMHFPPNAGLIFLTDKLTNDRYLVVTGAILSIVETRAARLGVLCHVGLEAADGDDLVS